MCSAHDVESTKAMFEGSSRRLMLRRFDVAAREVVLICSMRWERAERRIPADALEPLSGTLPAHMMTSSIAYRSCNSSRTSSGELQPAWSCTRLIANRPRLNTTQSPFEQQGSSGPMGMIPPDVATALQQGCEYGAFSQTNVRCVRSKKSFG